MNDKRPKAMTSSTLAPQKCSRCGNDCGTVTHWISGTLGEPAKPVCNPCVAKKEERRAVEWTDEDGDRMSLRCGRAEWRECAASPSASDIVAALLANPELRQRALGAFWSPKEVAEVEKHAAELWQALGQPALEAEATRLRAELADLQTALLRIGSSWRGTIQDRDDVLALVDNLPAQGGAAGTDSEATREAAPLSVGSVDPEEAQGRLDKLKDSLSLYDSNSNWELLTTAVRNAVYGPPGTKQPTSDSQGFCGGCNKLSCECGSEHECSSDDGVTCVTCQRDMSLETLGALVVAAGSRITFDPKRGRLSQRDPFWALDSAKRHLRDLRNYTPADSNLSLASYALRDAVEYLLLRCPEAVATRDARVAEELERSKP
jgi:hypothetical protein